MLILPLRLAPASALAPLLYLPLFCAAPFVAGLFRAVSACGSAR